jgi:murein DD-endopeptidase MepM/ murein hydrolase activator NlpD
MVSTTRADKEVGTRPHRNLAALVATVGALLCLGAGAASAQVAPTGPGTAPGGGTTAPTDPQISGVQCLTRCIGLSAGVAKSKVKIFGSDLSATTVVSFPRANGLRTKDQTPVIKPNGAVLARVPKGAVTGPIRLGDNWGQVRDSLAPFTVGSLAQLKEVQSQYTFPVRGAHNYGGAEAGFGAGRDGHIHQGQDVFASCGTPLVVAHTGTVKARGFHGSAGNYVVIDGAGVKQDYFYAHLTGPAKVGKGQSVTTGQPLGKVGQTGNAQGCHLHFEIWAGRGWYSGGSAIDPLPTLRYWDSFS